MFKLCKIGLALLYMVLLAPDTCAQADLQKALDNFNTFQQNIVDNNLDSAFQNAQELAGRHADLLNDLIHNSFAQLFTRAASNRVDSVLMGKLLQRMYLASANRPLQQSVYPLYKWVEVRRELNNPPAIQQSITGFLKAQARSAEEPGNRIDRYALLMYGLLSQKPEYRTLADTLLKHTRQRLEHAVNGIYYQATDDRKRRPERAYFRYLMACSSLIKANGFLLEKNSVEAESSFKEASQFGPDENDRQVKYAYFYESAFLFNNEQRENFHRPYIDFLIAKGDTSTALEEMTTLALADPGTIELLKGYYAKAPVKGQPFSKYWRQRLNEKLKPTEPFQLIDIDKQTIDYEKYKGKWILIDFWGTWCAPCVKELPEFQKFYGELAKNNPQGLVVFTAACHDPEPRVREFMKKQAYTFPVVMADEKLIKQFRVDGYPTKVLITPQGNRMKIPFGSNWAERVKIYLEN